jgi:hypothetical protein
MSLSYRNSFYQQQLNLSSLRHWFSYIVAEESDRLTAEEKQQIQQVSDRVFRWIGSYRKEGALKHLEKMDADLGKLITPEKLLCLIAVSLHYEQSKF